MRGNGACPFRQVAAVLKKAAGLVRRRQTAGDVDGDTTDKRRVVADFRRRHSDGFQLFEDVFIDHVSRRRQVGDRRAERHDRAKHGHPGLIAHHHRDIARLPEQLHVAGFIGSGQFLVV